MKRPILGGLLAIAVCVVAYASFDAPGLYIVDNGKIYTFREYQKIPKQDTYISTRASIPFLHIKSKSPASALDPVVSGSAPTTSGPISAPSGGPEKPGKEKSSQEEMVGVTVSGEHYHRPGKNCGGGDIKLVPLSKAKERYTPCDTCYR